MRIHTHHTVAVAFATLLAGAASALQLGGALPLTDVKMKNVDGRQVSLAEIKGAKGTLVVFTCNHCPWAKAWETRIVELGNTYGRKGIGVIAINANDPREHKDDGFDEMVVRARARGYRFPYVVDSGSQLAKAFDATRTPEAFVFDAQGTLVYHGTIDDNADDPAAVKQPYLRDALEAVVGGKNVTAKETKALGCGIKFYGS